MNAQTKITPPDTRWADPAAKRFHAYLEALLPHLDPESDAASLCFQTIQDIEALDCALPKGKW